MNKEQIDEIALEVAHGLPCIMNHIDAYVAWTNDELTSYAHALIAELAKVSEPVAEIVDGGCYSGFSRIVSVAHPILVGTKLFAAPLPQPDLVAENERLKEQSANRLIGLCKAGDDNDELRKQLSAAQADNEQLLEHIARIAEYQKDRDWQMMGLSIREADDTFKVQLAAHKARQQGKETT